MIIIGFSADIGYILGDTKEHCRFIFPCWIHYFSFKKYGVCLLYCVWKCSTFKGTRTRAAFVFVIGFWLLDLANNTVQVSIISLFAFCKWCMESSDSNCSCITCEFITCIFKQIMRLLLLVGTSTCSSGWFIRCLFFQLIIINNICNMWNSGCYLLIMGS